MTEQTIKKLPFYLSLSVFLTTVIAMALLDGLLVMVGLFPLIIPVGIVAAIISFIMSAVGLKILHSKPNLSSRSASVFGAAWGLLIISIPSFIFIGEGIDDVLWAIATIFVLGGFLAPLIGGILSYKIVNTREMRTSNA